MREAVLRILLLAALVSTAAAAQWTVYVQGSDPNGEWGFLNFYPKALTINPGDNVTFIQNHDAGVLVMLDDASIVPSPFYEPQPASCAGKCVALTPYSVPTGGGPLSNANAKFTHVNNLQGPFSAGFIGTVGQVPPFVPDRWTFYFDPAILGTNNVEVAVRFWEVLHAMSIQIKINPSAGAIVKTPAEVDVAAKAQIQTDANLAPTIFQTTVAPINGAIYNNEICAWVVHLGAQVTSSPTNDGYGIGTFDRYLPFDTVNRVSNIDINEGDSINFLQITPHGHAVSIYGRNHSFADSAPSFDPVARTLVEPITHFVPTPTPVNGVIHFDGTQAVTGPMVAPGQNLTVKFDAVPDTYYTFCVFHQTVNMVGTITVHPKGTIKYPSGTPGKCKAAGSAVYPMAVLVALLLAMLL